MKAIGFSKAFFLVLLRSLGKQDRARILEGIGAGMGMAAARGRYDC